MTTPALSFPRIRRAIVKQTKRAAAALWRTDAHVIQHKGLLWLLNRRNRVDRKIICGGYEETQMTRLLTAMQGGCDVFVDVGANFGLYSLQVAASGLARRLVALEPDPRNYAQLMANLYLNELTMTVQTHCLAASDREGTVSFEVYPTSSTGQSRIVADAARSACSIEVATKPLDALFPLTGQRLFFKIDVEGHELAALRGAESLLRSNDCFLQIEAWPENAAALKAYMENLGYRCLDVIEEDYYFAKTSPRT